MVSNKSLIFARIPSNTPIPGQDLIIQDRQFDLNIKPPSGGFTAKVLYASLDPYLRHLMVSPENRRHGFEPIPVGNVICNGCIVEVLSIDESATIKKGDILVGPSPIAEYANIEAETAIQFMKIQNPLNLDLKLFLGALGMPGLTAYSAFYQIGQPKAGETIFISAASGAVGQMVGQLAKREGLIVIGSVGNDEKLMFLKEQLGFDTGFNYKKGNILEQLKTLAPEGIDIYYDNVAGEQLDAALVMLKDYGRIVACGYASQYNFADGQGYGIRNTGLVVNKRLTWKGLSVFDEQTGGIYAAEHQENVQKWIHDGTFKPLMDVTQGIDNAAEALVRLLQGKNVGKAVLKLGCE